MNYARNAWYVAAWISYLQKDKPCTTVESQRKVIQTTPNPEKMPTAHDRGVTIFNRMVEKMTREEGAILEPVV